MPTYRYECPHCRTEHEIFHSMKDHSVRKCPDCGGELRRHVGGAGGVILKGSGFHNTDYRSASYRKAAKKDGAAEKKPSPKEKKKSEPKKKKPSDS